MNNYATKSTTGTPTAKALDGAAAALPTVTRPQAGFDAAVGGSETDLMLLALAAGTAPADGWWLAAGVSERQLGQLKQEQAARFHELRALAVLGGCLPTALLTDLLKARLYQRLLASDNAAELERLAKIIERLPEDARDGGRSGPARRNGRQAACPTEATASRRANAALQRPPLPNGGQGQPPSGNADPGADVDGMELGDLLAEAKDLIAQLETEQASGPAGVELSGSDARPIDASLTEASPVDASLTEASPVDASLTEANPSHTLPSAAPSGDASSGDVPPNDAVTMTDPTEEDTHD